MTWKLELLFEFEILDKGLISLIVGSLEIGEKLGTLCDVNCQRTLCTIVVSVGQKVSSEICNLFGQKSDLDFGVTSILLVFSVLLGKFDDFFFC